jgi:predicted ester cyclase
MTDRETARALLTRLIEHFWNRQALDDVGSVFAPDAVLHSGPNDHAGHAGIRSYAAPFMAAFPDLRFEIQHLLVDGDMGAMRFRGTGHLARDWDGVKAAGQALTYHGNGIFRLKEGRIAEAWSNSDLAAWMAKQPRA